MVVKAQDNGIPQLEAICTLAVTIEDINDNSPVFDKANYNVPIPQDTNVGKQIMRVSATDVDEGENQRITYDLISTQYPSDIDYFEWDFKTGQVLLKRKLDKPIGHIFQLKATASDGGKQPKSTDMNINLEVKESNNKPPTFETGPANGIIQLPEDYHNFGKEIATYTAKSNIPDDPTVFFLLLNGRTEKTNKDGTFRYVQSQDNLNEVKIFLAKTLVFENVNEYTLTLQVRNSPDLVAEAQLIIKIEDVNNLAPIFTNVESGSVLENEPAGTFVMQVSAVDNDGSFPNNRVTYAISQNNPQYVLDRFVINPDTGVLSTKNVFDREERPVYSVIINAEDGAPSSLLNNGQPNETPNNFRIEIKDKNDNSPFFRQQRYYAEVPEDQDVGSKVIEVRAEDLDTEASVTRYEIDEGNVGQAFSIEKETGFIRVAKPLDYENIKKYNLRVSAWDGEYGNNTFVEINVKNVNDMKPQFTKDEYMAEIFEETLHEFPIVQVAAYDPDIGDRSVEQNITYYLDSSARAASYFYIDKHSGNLKVIKKLDRDLPNGYPTWELFVFAKDENGGPKGIENFVSVKVNLLDINDNPPYLDMPDGLVWPENKDAGVVGVLVADDYDNAENGPPFTYEISSNAGHDISNWFGVEQIRNKSYVLTAKRSFDREQKKEYQIPIRICDHKNLCGISNLKLIIGDENDNPMSSGSSEIFVYNYQGHAPETDIGRVYVEDPDDWDLPDKTFDFKEPYKWKDQFRLDRQTGVIRLKEVTFPQGSNILNYVIDFLVEDPVHGQVNENAVSATVNITVKRISKEAVLKSGSMRIEGNPEDFIRQDADGYSKRDRFSFFMKRKMNATHFDVFTVIPQADQKYTDIRFAAHGSPYYLPERMEGTIAEKKFDIESELGITISMIHIDECLHEKEGPCAGKSCVNDLRIDNQPVSVLTNKTSFVGVQARIFPLCSTCVAPKQEVNSCNNPNPCLNNGTCELIPIKANGRSYRCQCPANNNEIFGPNCERLAASFNGQGWSWHKGLPACGNTHLSLIFKTQSPSGTLLYNGPTPNTVITDVTDFMLLEIVDGKLKLYINFGSGVRELELGQQVDDNKEHYLAMRWTNDTVQMELESCSNEISSSRRNCFDQKTTHDSKHRYLNTNGPLQVGGISFAENSFDQFATNSLGIRSLNMPHTKGFAGCIKNLTFTTTGRKRFGFGQDEFLYDLGDPADGRNYRAGCDDAFVAAVKATDLNITFLILILSCLAVLLLVICILIVYRRKKHVYSDKDIDCDIRENIINYEDEGGGEGDQTGYDLSVLRMMSDGTNGLPHLGNGGMLTAMTPNEKGKILPLEAAPDIQTFLQTNKDRIDGDPEATPYDDLRHYAYEGDGNSGGSLSSLNSGTSDADLEFDYLHNFGPRFKKLADMYGEQPDSSDDEEDGICNDDDIDGMSREHHHHQQYPHQHHQHRAGSHLSDRFDDHQQMVHQGHHVAPNHTHPQQYHPHQHEQHIPSNYATSPNMVMMPGGTPVPPPSESWC